MPVAATSWVICLCEAYELCLIPGARILVKNFKLCFNERLRYLLWGLVVWFCFVLFICFVFCLGFFCT